MRISAVVNFQIPQIKSCKKENSNMTSNLHFCSNDTFHRGSIIETEISNLKENIENNLDPYRDKYSEKYKLTGLIGFDSQEKLKLVQDFEQKLFQKNFNYMDNPVFKKVERVTDLYKEYQNNIREFENNAKIAENNKFISTPELKDAIEKRRLKMYRDQEEFEKIKPLYDVSVETQREIAKDLEDLNSKKPYEFVNGIKQLNEQNKGAIFFMLTSGYPEMLKIYADANTLIKEAENPKTNHYDLMQRLEKINNNIEMLKRTIENTDEENNKELEEFLEKNKDYKQKNLSDEEIKNEYNKLLQTADKIIHKHTKELDNYYLTNPVKLSPRLIDRTLKTQKRINKEINLLIYKEKEKKYRQSTDEFNSKYD